MNRLTQILAHALVALSVLVAVPAYGQGGGLTILTPPPPPLDPGAIPTPQIVTNGITPPRPPRDEWFPGSNLLGPDVNVLFLGAHADVLPESWTNYASPNDFWTSPDDSFANYDTIVLAATLPLFGSPTLTRTYSSSVFDGGAAYNGFRTALRQAFNGGANVISLDAAGLDLFGIPLAPIETLSDYLAVETPSGLFENPTEIPGERLVFTHESNLILDDNGLRRVVPEPGSLLLGLAALGVAALGRRRRAR